MSSTPDPGAPSSARALRMPRQARRDNPEARMSLIEHIRELRSRLLKALLGLAVGMTIGWIFFNPVWKFLERPYCNIKVDGQGQCTGQFGHTLVVNGVFDAFF